MVLYYLSLLLCIVLDFYDWKKESLAQGHKATILYFLLKDLVLLISLSSIHLKLNLMHIKLEIQIHCFLNEISIEDNWYYPLYYLDINCINWIVQPIPIDLYPHLCHISSSICSWICFWDYCSVPQACTCIPMQTHYLSTISIIIPFYIW